MYQVYYKLTNLKKLIIKIKINSKNIIKKIKWE